MFRKAFLICLMFMLCGCDEYPKDPDNTFKNIQVNGVLRVGVIEHRPWAYEEGGQPKGLEPHIISEFAQSLQVTPQWNFLSEAQATEKLKNHELDVVIGGLTVDTPRAKILGLSRPYLETGRDKKDHHVMAVSQGENYFLTTLEKFLKAREREIIAMYEGERS